MADSNPSNQTHQILSATYQSPTNAPFTLTQQIPSSSSSTDPATASSTPSDPAQRASYLGALRRATADLQEQINSNLTARMEEDNKARDDAAAATAAGSGTKGKKGVDEDKEEDNYGEEVVDDDE